VIFGPNKLGTQKKTGTPPGGKPPRGRTPKINVGVTQNNTPGGGVKPEEKY